jgi:uncharacterized protein YutE (UPF0331/DUF86 family)
MVGMRNRLVYLHDEIDDELVARAAAEELGDWDAFARAIAHTCRPSDLTASTTPDAARAR